MTTLKGLFEPKPRHQRNFLQENKREVKAKSMSNSQINKQVHCNLPQSLPRRSAPAVIATSRRVVNRYSEKQNPTQHPKIAATGKLRNSASKFEAQPHHQPANGAQTHHQMPDSAQSRHQLANSARTVHYIDQENVPFEWTEVCPSLISHNICHQGVQTEGSKTESLTKQVKPLASDMRIEAESERRNLSIDRVNEAQNDDFSNKIQPHCKSSKPEPTKLSTPRKLMSSDKATDDTVCLPTHQRGVIPKYLSKRKSELALASTRAKEIDPNCPPGHVAMPDYERRETLDMILKNYNGMIIELNKIPVRTDTLKMKQKKIEIEKQLDKLEEGIRIFSRSKVYVKLDA